MRALIGLSLLAGAALLGSQNLAAINLQSLGLQSIGFNMLGLQPGEPSGSKPAPVGTPGPMFNTVAATDPGSQPPPESTLTSRPAAIEPIVAPVTRLAPGTAQAKHGAKGKAAAHGSSETRPGFKLTCTSSQRLDAARQKCVAKSTATAGLHKPRA